MAATVLAFPDRGGNGFSVLDLPKRKKLNLSNICSLAVARAIKIEAERYPEERDFTLVRSPELLICMALFKAMPTDQRARAIMTVNETYAQHGDEDSRVASNLLAALSLSDREGR